MIFRPKRIEGLTDEQLHRAFSSAYDELERACRACSEPATPRQRSLVAERAFALARWTDAWCRRERARSAEHVAPALMFERMRKRPSVDAEIARRSRDEWLRVTIARGRRAASGLPSAAVSFARCDDLHSRLGA